MKNNFFLSFWAKNIFFVKITKTGYIEFLPPTYPLDEEMGLF